MVQTGIELQEYFNDVLYDVMYAVNMAVSSMYDMRQALNVDVDISSMEGARDRISQAAMVLQELNEAMEETSSLAVPALGTFAAGQQPADAQVQWQSDNMRIFTDTGADRFRLEIASANQMLERLSTTQDSIARQAYSTNIFPPQSFQNLNSLAVRIDTIRERVSQIENNPMNFGGGANTELEQLRSQLNQAVQQQESLNCAMENMNVSAANGAYLRLSQTVGSMERYIRDNVNEQGQFNHRIEQGTNQTKGLMQAIKSAVDVYDVIHAMSASIKLSDQLVSTTAHLDMMNDGLQTTQELQNMIFLSAERSRSSYQATANAVSKLGFMSGDAFSGNEEMVAFVEQINKQFTIAGIDESGIDAAMSQLTQVMGSGVMGGEEYNSILEQAPNIIQAIADYMEVPKGQLKDMAAEGEITADIVKAAMFAAADETNAKFASMPMTFAQIWTSFQNNALLAFQPVLERMNEIVNSEEFQAFVGNAINGLYMISNIVLGIFDLMVAAAGVVADNWSWISPIILGVAAALAVYYGWQVAVNAIHAVSKGIHIAMAVAQMMHAAATGGLTLATAANIAAQNGLNTAMYACPIMWIIILIVALIAIFYAAVAAVNHFAGTSISATGIICGIFAVAGAFIGNLVVMVINAVIDVFCMFWNFIAMFANFFGSIFDDPINAIGKLFCDLADFVLGILENIASAIDTIFGSNFAGTVSGWRDTLDGWVDKKFKQSDEVMKKINGEDYHLDRFEYDDAWNNGYDFGQGIEDTVSDLFNFDNREDTNDLKNIGDTDNLTGTEGVGDLGGGVADGLNSSGAAGNLDDISGNTGDIADSMNITKEDLKYLRDIAEQETVNRFTTAQINIDQSGMQNTVNGTNDLDGFVSGLTEAVKETVEAIAEGVHN